MGLRPFQGNELSAVVPAVKPAEPRVISAFLQAELQWPA
jgi:hypothetical protein